MVLGLTAWAENNLQTIVDTFNQIKSEDVEVVDITIEEEDSSRHYRRLQFIVVKKNSPEEEENDSARNSDEDPWSNSSST